MVSRLALAVILFLQVTHGQYESIFARNYKVHIDGGKEDGIGPPVSRFRRQARGIPDNYQFSPENQRPSDVYHVTGAPSTRSQNLRKPEFTNCGKDVNPSVQEGEPVNTTVYTITAVDQDAPESGGTVTFTIVSGNENNDKFVIDPRTGVIRTNKVFDRDEPEREKEEYITIRASDNGKPQLDSVCTLRITITDINDNAPLFERFEYKESVPRDLAVGEVVMRISATDIDDAENGTVGYQLESDPSNPRDIDYFQISETTGEVTLKKPMDSAFDELQNSHQFVVRAVATDKGRPPKSTVTTLTINVVDPLTRPPVFHTHRSVIELPERTVDKSVSIEQLTADSRSSSSELVFFELVNGQTDPTNKGGMFTLETNGNVASLKLDKDLDYETVSRYTLTIRVANKDKLATETTIIVVVKDENDEKPEFQDVTSGQVLENEPVGTSVTRVKAIDRDGTAPHNVITYTLKEEDKENFQIDPSTGEITTKKMFDREAKDVYQVTVIAKDGSPSVLRKDGEPNERPVTIKIEIADKNDNPPRFLRDEYEAEISEDADINNKVIEVKAVDNDTASEITYTLHEGNIGDAFYITSSKLGGVIYVKNRLDYEKIREYHITVRASDGLHDAHTQVRIKVLNINDEPPVFERMETKVTIQEETVPLHCIFQLRAYDPDIEDRTLPQNISFFINKGQDHFSVDNEGCVKVTKPLDRDPPKGQSLWQIIVGAYDEGGLTKTKKEAYQVLEINLLDINDNAPYYDGPNPLVWDENQPRGPIQKLTATDVDTPANGAPFNFEIDRTASPEIRTLFKIERDTLWADKDNFDREARKEYQIPVVISDSGQPVQTGTSIVTVIIGDKNDNPMYNGESKIFVYKYKEQTPFSIGRVYVEDLDDWDLPDKTFDWETGVAHPNFELNKDNGSISLRPETGSGQYFLTFKVQDHARNEQAKANVTVTVKEITDEAVDNSGSIRFMGITKESFVTPGKNGKSKKDLLQEELAALFGVPVENVDVFTVLNSTADLNKVDVRYSVHNSPYWKAEKLDGILASRKKQLEKALQLNIVMIRVDECISERLHCESSCTNRLQKSDSSYVIATNTSTFVGVDALVVPECTCASAIQQTSCFPNNNPCLHGGICKSSEGINSYECECKAGYTGPRCELTSVSFNGNGYVWYSPISVCNDSLLEVEFTTGYKHGLIFYNGPVSPSPMTVTDFVSLELRDGKPVLLMNYGTGVTSVEIAQSPDLGDSHPHHVSIKWNPVGISMRVGDCLKNEVTCFSGVIPPKGSNTQLNVNGPLQVGGLSFKPASLQSDMNWSAVPTTKNFVGCIAKFTYNGMYYDLGEPSYAYNMNVTDCQNLVIGALGDLGFDWNFWIVILVCILVLTMLIVGFLIYRKRRTYQHVKGGEFNDDVRDNILQYSEEAGEGDQTGYDLSVLMKATNNGLPYNPHPTKIPLDDLTYAGRVPQPGDNPDIQGFLQGNKDMVDNDPDGLPYDDVRNYAYEGDNNSMGSLSSLASGTDDEDLNFDFLPAFGPRFKKLADMYGGHSSDDESSYAPSQPPAAWGYK